MTWNELSKRIAKMPESERGKEAVYREPYDDDPEMIAVHVYEAMEDLVDPEGRVKIKKSEFFLQ